MSAKAEGKKELLHRTITIRMTVTNGKQGTAKFDEDNPEVATTAQFRNARFRNFETGQQVIASFRLSGRGRRNLVHVRAINDEGSFDTPQLALGHYIAPEVQTILSVASLISKQEGKFVVALRGGSGYGKTSIAEVFAKITGRKHTRINCALMKDPEEWFGVRSAKGGTTYFQESQFAKALVDGDSVIVLDEVNRLEPWALNSLLPILDFDGKITVLDKEFIVGENTVFVLTLNMGLQFTGTYELDEAFSKRISATGIVSAPPPETEVAILIERLNLSESLSRQVVDSAKTLRKMYDSGETTVDCSIRSTLQIGRQIMAGLGPRQAFSFVIENTPMPIEERKIITDRLNADHGMLPAQTLLNDNVFRTTMSSENDDGVEEADEPNEE